MGNENIFRVFPCLGLVEDVWDLSGHTSQKAERSSDAETHNFITHGSNFALLYVPVRCGYKCDI